jgi:integrase
VFRYAISRGIVSNDPTIALRGSIRVPATVHKDELDIGPYLKAAKAQEDPLNGYAMVLLLLLACRPGELRQMKWSQIDFTKKTWTLPAAGMKMKREHVWPLAEEAIAVLKKIAHVNEYVFASPRLKGNKPFGDETLRKCMKLAKLRGSPHSVRTTFSTWAHENGYETHIIEAALAHKERNTVKASYNKAQYLPQRSLLAAAWAKNILSKSRHK